MKRIDRWRWWMIGAALGVFGVLLFSPATGWIVRSHLRVWRPPVTPTLLQDLGLRDIPLSGNYLPEDEHLKKAQAQAVAARHPNDYPTNLACALSCAAQWNMEELRASGDITPTEAMVAPLLSRFSDEPTVYADVLRFSSARSLVTWRNEIELLAFDRVPARLAKSRREPLTAKQSAFLVQTAASGERLEPDNAYFPTMEAVALFGAHRDDEALAAVARAASKSTWNDHWQAEAIGRRRLLIEATGDRSSLSTLCFSAGILFPHYAQIRSMFQVATYKAVEAERYGRKRDGLVIRSALMQIGGLMRAQSGSLIGSLVGIGSCQVATKRPGGVPASPEVSGSDAAGQAERAERRARYCAYLRGIGQADEALWVERELAACDRVPQIVRRAVARDDWLLQIGRASAIGLAARSVFVCAAWMLLATALAAMASRSRRISAGLPLSTGARVGVAAGMVLAVGLGIAAATQPISNAALVAMMLVPSAAMACIARARTSEGFWAGVAVASFASATIAVTGALMFLLLRPGLALTMGMARVLPLLASGSGTAPALDLASVSPAFLPLLIVPATALVITIVSWRCRVPVSVGLARGFRGIGVPLACLLVLPYAAIVATQARAETRENAAMERRWQGEGRYMAELVGEEWPGVTK